MPKISELPALAKATSEDLIPIVDDSGNITKKVRAADSVPANSVNEQAVTDGSIAPAKLGFKTLKYLGSNTRTTTSGTIPTSWTTFATVTATTGAGKVLLGCKTNIKDGNSGATRAGNIRLAIDGNVVPGTQIQYWTPNGLKDSPGLDIEVDVTAGSHVFALQATADVASASEMKQASLVVQEVVGS